ncbi:hypothetical protein HOI26_00110 [Candidatus Woesearchaeota archaeon]|jgi:uncharacterized protein with PIN domain|nr:hypothetical protein [Candidatus Woesearchaeota archaeon]MBT5739478.1 hypothetical protein [Candidatus Woesearchaeota archaeon]
MAKCSICKAQLAETFLGKIKGTIVKKASSSKKYSVCFSCQKKFSTKEELLEQLKKV